MSEHGSKKAIFYALGANLGIALAKAVAAFVTSSGAMLAEAIHSFADCANQGLLFLGLHRARRAPTADHPLGFGKALYFWSFIVALMLFSMGGLFSIYEGVHKLLELRGAHEGVQNPWVAVAVLAIASVLEALSLAGALRESRPSRKGRSLWQWFRESRHSELIVVVGEDVAALAGLLLALAAVLLTLATGDPLWDALGSMGIGALLILVAVAVAVEVKSLLIGESAEPELEARIRGHLAEQPAIEKLLHLITVQLGARVMVAVKAKMAPTGTEEGLVAAVNACERSLRREVPEVQWVFFEPDVED